MYVISYQFCNLLKWNLWSKPSYPMKQAIAQYSNNSILYLKLYSVLEFIINYHMHKNCRESNVSIFLTLLLMKLEKLNLCSCPRYGYHFQKCTNEVIINWPDSEVTSNAGISICLHTKHRQPPQNIPLKVIFVLYCDGLWTVTDI